MQLCCGMLVVSCLVAVCIYNEECVECLFWLSFHLFIIIIILSLLLLPENPKYNNKLFLVIIAMRPTFSILSLALSFFFIINSEDSANVECWK